MVGLEPGANGAGYVGLARVRVDPHAELAIAKTAGRPAVPHAQAC